MAKKPLTFDTPFDTYTSSSIVGEGGAGRVHVVRITLDLEFAQCLAQDTV